MRNFVYGIMVTLIIGIFIRIPLSAAENDANDLIFDASGTKYSLNKLKENWPLRSDQMALKGLVRTKDNRASEFLHRIAIQDPELYKGRIPEAMESVIAVKALGTSKTSESDRFLNLLLSEELFSNSEKTKWEVRVEAARMILRRSAAGHEMAYSVLSRAAQNGVVGCPYPDGLYDAGVWKGTALSAKQRNLLEEWMNSSDIDVRLQSALCAVRASVEEESALEIVKTLESAPSQNRPTENTHFYASQVLHVLTIRGNKNAKDFQESHIQNRVRL